MQNLKKTPDRYGFFRYEDPYQKKREQEGAVRNDKPLSIMNANYGETVDQVQKKYGIEDRGEAVKLVLTTPYGDLMARDVLRVPLILDDQTNLGDVSPEGLLAIMQNRLGTYGPVSNWEYQTLNKLNKYVEAQAEEYAKKEYKRYAEIGAQSKENPYNSFLPKVNAHTADDGREYGYYVFLTNADEAQREYINYLYGYYDPKEAKDKEIQYIRKFAKQNMENMIDEGGGLGWFAQNVVAPLDNVGYTSLSPIYFTELGIQGIKNLITNQDEKLSKSSLGSQIMDGKKTSEELFIRNDEPFTANLKEIGLGVAQSALNKLLFKGAEPIASALQSAADSAYEAGQQGGTNAQQLLKGSWDGLLDYGVGKLMPDGADKTGKDGAESVLDTFLDQAVKNYAEGTAKETGSILGDTIIMDQGWGTGSTSQYNAYIRDFLEKYEGSPEAAAIVSYLLNTIKQTNLSGANNVISGAISGGWK